MRWLFLWFVLVSAVAAVTTIFDKRAAQNGLWRVPERTLWCLAAIGGASAMFLTMRLIRHKTRKASFMFGLPLLILVHVGAVVWLTSGF